MKIVFTLCSNNYLAQAKTLGDSVGHTNPDYKFFIGLTDKISDEIDYPTDITHTIVLSDEIGIPNFDTLWGKYSIIEFNTCVKPFYFQYFINQFPDIEYIFYLDPDTFVYGNLNIIEQEFGENGRTLLTPHITKPIKLDDKIPKENQFLIYGIYNLGFLGFKYPQQNSKLLEWWQERTYHLGYGRPNEGLFVDQLWLNFAPVFFDEVVISKHPGLNMAPWNLHERSLTETNNTYFVNDVFPLIFYHFSNYNYTEPNSISRYYTRYNFMTNKDLITIYQKYHELLTANGIQKMERIKWLYTPMKEQYIKNERKISYKKMAKAYLKRTSNKVFKKN
jgi:hypothetical protein